MRSFVVIVLDELPVELEPCMLEVVGSEPSFDLAERGGFADAAEDMLDPLLMAVHVERGLASAHAPELASVVGEDLSWLRVFVDCSVEQPDHVLRGALAEVFGCGYESGVVV